MQSGITFRKGEAFEIYGEFESKLDDYCKREHVFFVTEKGEKLKNTHCVPIDPDRPYVMKRFRCQKHKEGCKAHIRLRLRTAGPNRNSYQITRVCLDHDHSGSTQPSPPSFISPSPNDDFIEIDFDEVLARLNSLNADQYGLNDYEMNLIFKTLTTIPASQKLLGLSRYYSLCNNVDQRLLLAIFYLRMFSLLKNTLFRL